MTKTSPGADSAGCLLMGKFGLRLKTKRLTADFAPHWPRSQKTPTSLDLGKAPFSQKFRGCPGFFWEDGCTGRFWEGRFKCQALLDEQAVLSCMAYVDLNPVRAGMCETLRASEHTSVRHRLEAAGPAIGKALGRESHASQLKPVAGLYTDTLSDLTEFSYIELVRWTGLQAHPHKRGKLSVAEESPPEGLWSVANHPQEWMRRVQGTESRYYRAIGSAEALMLKAADLGQRWMKGVSGEFALKKLREQPIPW